MKRPRLDRSALVLTGCLFLLGMSGCRGMRGDTGEAVCNDCNDRTLFHFRGGRWETQEGQPTPATTDSGKSNRAVPDPAEYPNFRAPRSQSAYGSGSAGESPVYRQFGPTPVPGPQLRTPPRGIAPDDGSEDESDAVGKSARPSLRQRLVSFWKRPATENDDDDAAEVPATVPNPPPAANGSPVDPRARNVQTTSTRPSQLAGAVPAPTQAPPRQSASVQRPRDDARLVTLAAPPAIAQSAQRPSYSLPKVANHPELQPPPSGVGLEKQPGLSQQLSIRTIRICRQVRGFDDFVSYDPGKLRPGQPILIYASLEDFRSVSTAKGYRTLTLSTLEVRSSTGEVLARQPLGTAVDLAREPRREFFLTHQLTIPEDLPPGDYVFGLCVDDLLGHSTARAEIAVRVMEDRNLRDGTAGISVSARSPAGSPR